MRQELLIRELFPALRDGGLDKLPDPEKLAAGLKEEVLVEQTVVEQCAGLLPVAEHHHRQRPVFRSRRGNAHGVVETLHDVVLEVPIASLAESRLTPHLEDL